MTESTEILARAIHEDYVRRQREQGTPPEDNPSMVGWDALAETLRRSNRDQAADIGRKLQAVGCEMAASSPGEGEPFEFTLEEVELLARMEHERWWRDREADGWTFGPVKDVEKKTSPYLVPYDELTEDVKEMDRDAVRGIPSFLAEVGFVVVRIR